MKINPVYQNIVGQKLPPAPHSLHLNEELLRINLVRLMDDGTQTLGYMDVLDSRGKTLYSLATVELPWKNNQNKISCIPVGNYRVISYSSIKYGRCFWLIGNDNGGYEDNRITGNGYTRGSILIYAAPKATKDLQGCIGPGLKFNTQNKQLGIQKGTGQFYLSPSKEQSQQALNKLLDSLFSIGSFRMEISNTFVPKTDIYGRAIPLDNSYNYLPKSFDGMVYNIARSRNLVPNPYVAPK